MEVRETMHSPPFWASASNASNPSPTSPYSSSSSTQSGLRPWIIVLLFSIVVLLFLPSIVSTPFKRARFSLSIKSGWDMLNLCLVVFAILCGVLGRIRDGSRPESGSYKQPRNEWTGFSNPMGVVNRTAGMRRTRNSSSYPDLRLETDVWGQNRVPDSWRFFDDGELYRSRRPVQLYGASGPGEEERECRTIPVDGEKFPQLERVENETNFEEGRMESDIIYEEETNVREAMVVRRSLEALPKWEEVGNEPMVMVGRRRRRSLEKFPSIEEVAKETNFQGVEVQVEEEVDKPQMAARRRRKSLENFPIMNEIEEETKFEEEMVEEESETAERKAKSSEKLPEIEEADKDANFGENVVENPPVVAEVAPPPPPPPPPPLPETNAAEECRKHKRSGSGGGAKDIASAIALFYQKKTKGNKSKRKEKHDEDSIESNPNFNSTTESNSNTSAAAPPPPPLPPPSSIFYKFLSNKKAVSKSRRIHSLSASTHSSSPSTVNTLFAPSPPSPQPSHQVPHRPRKDQIDSLGYRRIEDTELYEYRRRENSNISSYANYPLPPRSPLPPAPPPPPSVRDNVSKSREQEEQKNGGVAVFCASPDVNDKADLFIKQFRDGLKLEIINSIKEKEKRKERQESRVN